MASRRVVLAEYFTTGGHVMLFLLREDFPQPLATLIERPLEEIRNFVSVRLRAGGGMPHLDEETFQDSLAPLIAPLAGRTESGDLVSEEGDLIVIVPHDVLHYIPLHALQLEGRYLSERNPVCYSPSASILQHCRAARGEPGDGAVVLGDSRNDLTHAREEASMVAGMFGVAPHLGKEATKSALRQELAAKQGRFRVVHLSCHGYFHPTDGLQSGVLLAPEAGDAEESQQTLTAEEIFGLELKADLVTLSACESGVNENRPGDELIGLTRAMIYAGAPSLVVSMWAVNDLSTSLLIRRFYENLLGAMSKAEALQAAQSYLRRLTAREVVAYCDDRLRTLMRPGDRARAMAIRLDRANIQARAGDLAATISAYREIHQELQARPAGWTGGIAAHIMDALAVLEPCAAEGSYRIDYEVQPYRRLYHWAPLALIGDWR